MNEAFLPPFLLGSILILAGLVFVLFIGQRQRTAPGNPDDPIIAEPHPRPGHTRIGDRR